jgi:hypothetical protein
VVQGGTGMALAGSQQGDGGDGLGDLGLSLEHFYGLNAVWVLIYISNYYNNYQLD